MSQSILTRTVAPEWLDELSPHEERAIASRRDLRRLNFWMGNARTLRRAATAFFPTAAPRQIVELGAGDGEFFLRFARLLAPRWPAVKIILVDRRPAITSPTRQAFEKLGWFPEIIAADVFDWLPAQSSLDLIVANLFLHHFEAENLARLLGLIAQHGRALVACEPRRCVAALTAARLLWLLGCNDVTRHDGLISVRAGFRARELSAAWPDARWNLREESAGFFSQLFAAQAPLS